MDHFARIIAGFEQSAKSSPKLRIVHCAFRTRFVVTMDACAGPGHTRCDIQMSLAYLRQLRRYKRRSQFHARLLISAIRRLSRRINASLSWEHAYGYLPVIQTALCSPKPITVFKREKIICKVKQLVESNSNLGQTIRVRFPKSDSVFFSCLFFFIMKSRLRIEE